MKFWKNFDGDSTAKSKSCDVRSGISPGEAILQIVRLSGRVKGCLRRRGKNFTMTSRVVKICFVHSRIFLFTLIDAVVKINVDELRIKIFQQFLFAYCISSLMKTEEILTPSIKISRSRGWKERSVLNTHPVHIFVEVRMPSLSTKLSFSPFRSSNLHTEGDRCALTSLCQQTPLLVCARVSISANAQQFLLPSLFFLPILFQFPTPFQQKIPSSHRWYIFSRRRLWF